MIFIHTLHKSKTPRPPEFPLLQDTFEGDFFSYCFFFLLVETFEGDFSRGINDIIYIHGSTFGK